MVLRSGDALNGYVGLGVIAWCQGEETEARRHFEQALAVWEEAIKSGHLSLADRLENKALALLGQGRGEDAIFTLTEALANLLPEEPFSLARHVLLATAPNPPQGAEQMLRFLEGTLGLEDYVKGLQAMFRNTPGLYTASA